MKRIFFVAILLVVITGACSTRDKYAVKRYLSPQQQDEMMWKIIRYIGRPPEGIAFEERFNAEYDSAYQMQKLLHRFDAYFKKGNTHYFLVSRRAPSLGEMRVATGVKLVVDGDNKITEYEEVFRTWKMVPDTLAKREMILFDKFVKGESLEPYETKNSHGVEYIEFPDESMYFDKGSRQWRWR